MGLKPGYKQTEVGVIPEDWDVVLLDSVTMRGTGHTPSKSHPEYWGGQIKWISLQDSDRLDRHYIHDTAVTITPAGIANSSAKMHSKGTVVLSRDAGVGKSSIMADDMAVSQHFIAWKCGPLLINHLLYFWLQANKSEFERIAMGNTIKTIGLPYFRELLVPLPKATEQEAIAEALSDADALIESLEQLLAKKRHLKQGAMQELLTGKKRLPGFSGKWNKKRLGDIADTDPESLSSSTSAEYAFNYIALEDAEMGTLRSHTQQVFRSAPSRARRKLRKNDVVVSTVRPNLKSHFLFLSENGEWVCSTGFSVLRCKDRVAHPAYVFFHMFGDYIVRQIETLLTGSNYPAINSRDVRALDIPLPGYEEQNAIAAVLSDMDNEINTLDAKLTKAHQLKTGMMQELLTGKIRLIHSAASVLPFEVKQQADVSPSKAHNPQINEAVVLAVLASRFGTEKYPLARVRRTKLMYLFHRHADHEATGFLKKAAGPYDPKVRYAGPEKIALKNRYVRSHHNGTYEGFIPGDNIAQAEGYFEKWYDSPALEWVEQFRHKRTEELELLATIDMACVDLRREGKAVSLSTVKRVLQDNAEWKAKLDRPLFSDDKINAAIESCQQLFPPEGDTE
jgi:type I restriction enzyme S subunit